MHSSMFLYFKQNRSTCLLSRKYDMTEEHLNVFKSKEIKHFLRRSKNIKRESMQLMKNLETKKEEFDKHMNAQVDHFKQKLTRTQSLDLQVAFGHQKDSNSSKTDCQHFKLPSINRSESPLQKPMTCSGKHVALLKCL